MSERITPATPDSSRIALALSDIRQGKPVIIADDAERENEGDLVIAAEKATPETVNLLIRSGTGIVCAPLTNERADALQLPPMTAVNEEYIGCAFTVSVDGKGTGTGVSAWDRTQTLLQLAHPQAKAGDFRRPGHVFPLRAVAGGVLKRAGHTEAAVDIVKLAGLAPIAAICEIMNADGTMARLPQLQEFAREHGIRLISIAELIAHRKASEKLVLRVASARLPTEFGEFTAVAFESTIDGTGHLALVAGELEALASSPTPPLVRVHSECLTGDAFHSKRCDCGPQLNAALAQIAKSGCGVLLYMRQEGRGIGLLNKLKAYSIQDSEGLDTVEANERLGFLPDLREYGTGAQILCDLGIRRMRLLTNNPRKVVGLHGFGLEVVERLPIQMPAGPENAKYLEAKRDKLGHLIS